MKATRCRFTANSVVQHKDNDGKVTQEDIQLGAVVGRGDKLEYEYSEQERADRDVQSFADATPWGNMEYCVNNPHVFGFIEEGKDYYITIEPVPEELQ